MVSLVDLLSNTYAPVQMMILPYLEVADVIALTLTCKGFDQLQPVLKVSSYDINRFLKRFFDDPLEFRSVQAECGAIVAGETIRTWFDRSNEASDSLTIYVAEKKSKSIINYISNEYPKHISTTASSGEYKCEKPGSGRVLCVRYEEAMPLAQILEDSPLTADLCFVTWNNAYALFPYTTFIRRECFLLQDMETLGNRLREITDDGLMVKSVSWGQAHDRTGMDDDADFEELLSLGRKIEDIRELVRRRRIGDKHTWSIQLDTTGVKKSGVPTAVLEANTFHLRFENKNFKKTSFYKLEFEAAYFCNHPVLEYDYIVVPYVTEESYYTARYTELWGRLNELAAIELSKLPTCIRPSLYPQVLQNLGDIHDLHGTFDLPVTWTFHDNALIEYLDKLWKIQQDLIRRMKLHAKQSLRSSRQNQFGKASGIGRTDGAAVTVCDRV